MGNADAVEARREMIVTEVGQMVRETLENLLLNGPGGLDLDAAEVAMQLALRRRWPDGRRDLGGTGSGV